MSSSSILPSWLLVLTLGACGPKPLPPEQARPPSCPELDPAAAAGLLDEALLALQPGDGLDFDGALRRAERLRRCRPSLPGLEGLEGELRSVAAQHAAALVDAGRLGEAHHQLSRLAGPLDLGAELQQLEQRLAFAMRDRAVRDEAEGRWASAYLHRALAYSFRMGGEERVERDRALQRFYAHESLGVHLSVELVPELQGQIAPRLDWSSRSWHWEPDAALAELRGRLRVHPPRCEEEIVVSVASQPARDPAGALGLARHRQAEERVVQAELGLRAAAEGSRRLRQALQALEGGDAAALESARRQPEVARLLEAREALAALPSPPSPAEPFRYELRTGTLDCRVFAQLWFEEGGGEVFEPHIGCSDSAHPAFVEQGIDEDPLRYPLTRHELTERLLDELVTQLGVTYERMLVERWQAQVAGLPEGALSDGQLEEAARAALLIAGGDPSEGERMLTALADRVLGTPFAGTLGLPREE
jgi:hypothetical protein